MHHARCGASPSSLQCLAPQGLADLRRLTGNRSACPSSRPGPIRSRMSGEDHSALSVVWGPQEVLLHSPATDRPLLCVQLCNRSATQNVNSAHQLIQSTEASVLVCVWGGGRSQEETREERRQERGERREKRGEKRYVDLGSPGAGSSSRMVRGSGATRPPRPSSRSHSR